MKALSLDRPGQLTFVELPEAQPGPGEIAVRVAYIGYCGTDLNSYRGTNPLMGYPRVPGHEISGTIAALGGDVPPGFRVGQAVTVLPYFNCGRCVSCRLGRPNACKHNETMGVQREGALTEFVCVPHAKVIPVDGMAQRDLTLIEPLAVGFHAVRRAEVQPGETVVVLGCGMIGLGAALGALDRGAVVVGVDLSASKLGTARRLGVQHTVDASREDVAARVAELTGEDGPPVVIEAVGSEQTFRQAVDLAASCGRVVYVGYAKNPVTYETRFFVMKEIEIRGSRGSQLDDFHQVIRYMRAHPGIGELIVSRVVPFAEAATAMRDWNADPGAFTKVLVDVQGALVPEAPSVFGLASHHAVVTGGGSGLGLATARCFLEAGAEVTICGTNEDKLRGAAEALGQGAKYLPFDVTRTAEAEDFAAEVERRFGPASILVNNAGQTIKKPIPDMTPGDFQAVLDVHVSGAYALSRAFLPQVERSGRGSILFTASMASFLGIPQVIGYSAAKAAHVGMVRAMATELAPRRVRVNGVAPGWIDTALSRGALANDPARKAKIDGRIAMGRFGEESDIGWAMTYLASDAARYVTGHVLVVDGGALHGF